MKRHDFALTETAASLRAGRRDLSSHARTILERLERVDPDLRAFVTESDREARIERAVSHLERRYSDADQRPPLYGVPVGVKDIFHVEGLPTRAGSELPPAVLTGSQGPVVDALVEAGAYTVGKTVTTEFAYYEPGPTRNPHAPEHTPGGSSSGSAAAVAAGLCPLALGTQTIGSVIRPASFCGVVGFKPSYDRLSREGVLPLAPSVDHVGLFTQDVAGMELAASVVCPDWTAGSPPERRPVLGVPEGPYLEQTTATGREHFEQHVATLRDAGYDVRSVSMFDDIDAVNDRHWDLVATEAALAHADWYAEFGDRYAAATAELVEDGRDVGVGRLADARTGRQALRDELSRAMDAHGVDCWITPAAPGPAPEGLESTGDPIMNLPWTHAGVPTVSLPASRTDDGRPLGLQVATDFGADEALLRWSAGLETALSD